MHPMHPATRCGVKVGEQPYMGYLLVWVWGIWRSITYLCTHNHPPRSSFMSKPCENRHSPSNALKCLSPTVGPQQFEFGRETMKRNKGCMSKSSSAMSNPSLQEARPLSKWIFGICTCWLSHIYIHHYIQVFAASQSLPQHCLCLCAHRVTRHLSIITKL